MRLKKFDVILKSFLKLNPKRIFIYLINRRGSEYLVFENNNTFSFVGGLWRKNESLIESLRKIALLNHSLFVKKINDVEKVKFLNGDLYLFLRGEIDEKTLDKKLVYKNIDNENVSEEVKIFLS